MPLAGALGAFCCAYELMIATNQGAVSRPMRVLHSHIKRERERDLIFTPFQVISSPKLQFLGRSTLAHRQPPPSANERRLSFSLILSQLLSFANISNAMVCFRVDTDISLARLIYLPNCWCQLYFPCLYITSQYCILSCHSQCPSLSQVQLVSHEFILSPRYVILLVGPQYKPGQCRVSQSLYSQVCDISSSEINTIQVKYNIFYQSKSHNFTNHQIGLWMVSKSFYGEFQILQGSLVL